MNNFFKKINLSVEKLYIIFFEASLFQAEKEAIILTNAIFSGIIFINIINIIGLFETITNRSLSLQNFHFIITIIIVYGIVSFYFSMNEKKQKIIKIINDRGKSVRKKSFLLAIIIYLLSLGITATIALAKN